VSVEERFFIAGNYVGAYLSRNASPNPRQIQICTNEFAKQIQGQIHKMSFVRKYAAKHCQYSNGRMLPVHQRMFLAGIFYYLAAKERIRITEDELEETVVHVENEVIKPSSPEDFVATKQLLQYCHDFAEVEGV